MKYRTTLIEWVLEVCADFGFGPTTADLAVRYMVRREAAKKTRNRARLGERASRSTRRASPIPDARARPRTARADRTPALDPRRIAS